MGMIDRLNGLTGTQGVKDPVLVVSTANLTLSGLQTVNGVLLVAGDRVLVKDQTNTVENGIYDAASTAWTRSKDFDGSYDIRVGSVVVAADGNQYRVTTAGTIGTGAVTFQHVAWQSNCDLHGYHPGVPTSSQVIYVLPIVRALTFDVDLALSRGKALVAATGSTTFDIAKNGVNFATMVFGAGATVPSFVCAIPPSFAAGDYLTVTAPASADASLSGVSFVLAAQV